ncbi:hypothetical protein [Desulfolutivibrio sulfodismutans]|uniref:hypothetical protein n=1 Tax=Desulfolutivibrio sulfodismutans TaxID=63561 RepID=UPI00159E8613|nr:hypothetical protein [Desulfolutivibrio sulfodismutans]QLA11512.1 hypothetical protein GD606_04090 [Desulfolutivibrio sulfodismutans DSM 3696]
MIVSRKLASGLGELPVGLILSRDQAGAAVPYEAVAAEAIGAGDGTDKTFSATLAKHPVQPGSVAVSDGVEDFADDGLGRLTGDAGGSGTINYATGAVAVEFHAAPANAAPVEAAYDRQFSGVLDEAVDTALSGAGLVIVHGSVRKDVLKVGVSAPAAPSAALLGRMEDHGIWPV